MKDYLLINLENNLIDELFNAEELQIPMKNLP